MNVAAVAAAGLTQMLQAGPLLAAVGSVDGLRVSLAVAPAARTLAGGLAGVDEVVPLAAGAGAGRRVAVGAARLRRRRLEATLVCSEAAADRLLVYASGCARRVGLRGGQLDVLLTDRGRREPGENRSLALLRLATAVGAMPGGAGSWFDPGPAARRQAESLMLGGGFEDGRLVVAIAPSNLDGSLSDGSSRALRWDAERYAHLANQLTARHGAGIVALGDPADRPLVDELLVHTAAPVLDLCGQLGQLDVAAVIERCDLVVSGDSPILHIAAGVGTASVGLFGPTDGRLRAPLGEDHRVIQAASAAAGLATIRVEDALYGIEARL